MSSGAQNGYPALPPHLDPRGRRHRSGGRQWRSGATRLLMSAGALLSVTLLIAAGYYWYTFRSIDRGVTKVQVAGAVDQVPTNAVRVANYKDENILIVGNDDRAAMTAAEQRALKVGRGQGSNATDTMMIVHVPADGSKATLISLPRDSYVHIPGFGMGKLNGAYVDAYVASGNRGGTPDQNRSAGAALLIRTIGDLTGLTIAHYIQVSLLGFYEISEAIGGVPVTLCHNVDDSFARNRAVGLDGGSGLVLSRGYHVILGTQALEFVRQRHFLPGGDLDRVRRQQYFLTAAFREVASVGVLTKLNAIGDAVKRNIYVDGGLSLLGLARQMENLSANNIIGTTIPTVDSGPPDYILRVDPAQVRRFVDRALNGAPAGAPRRPSPAAAKPSSTAAPSTASATVKTPKAIDARCIN